MCSIYQGEKGQLSSGDQSWPITSASIALSSDLSAEQLAKDQPGPAGAISPTDHLEPAPGDNNRASRVRPLVGISKFHFFRSSTDAMWCQVKHKWNVL